MKKYSTILFWILADALIIFAIPFFPSFFSIFCILAAIIFAPIEEWQNIINKFLKKPIKSAVLALLIAFVIALFPLSPIIAGVYKLANPDITSPSDTSSVFYYEEHSSDFSISSNTENTHSALTTTSNISSVISQNTATSSKISSNYTTSKNKISSSKAEKASSPLTHTQNNTSKEISNSNTVFRTPSGKRYHNSASCGGKNSYSVSYDDAIKAGLTPCKKCVK